MADDPSLDDELMAREEDDESAQEEKDREWQQALIDKQHQEFEAIQQQDRLRQQQQQSPQNQLMEAGKQVAKDYAKQTVKKGIWSFLAGTSEIWGPAVAILVVIGLVIGLFFFVVTTAIAYCNQGGLSGFAANTLSNFNWLRGGGDFCETLAINTQTAVENAPKPPMVPGEPDDLVYLEDFNIPVKIDIDGRATRCMVGKIQAIYAASQQAGIDWVITDAFRTGGQTAGGGVSAHSRGEAVDIALRDPTVDLGSNDPRINQLLAIARNAGFVGPSGDTLDEYRNPAPNATAGHVHVEFNIPAGGGTYCQV
jgi:hypothetical protein